MRRRPIIRTRWHAPWGARSGTIRGHAPVAQWIERSRPKAGVGGSNPSGGAIAAQQAGRTDVLHVPARQADDQHGYRDEPRLPLLRDEVHRAEEGSRKSDVLHCDVCGARTYVLLVEVQDLEDRYLRTPPLAFKLDNKGRRVQYVSPAAARERAEYHAAVEGRLGPCACGGRYRYAAPPRCPTVGPPRRCGTWTRRARPCSMTEQPAAGSVSPRRRRHDRRTRPAMPVLRCCPRPGEEGNGGVSDMWIVGPRR